MYGDLVSVIMPAFNCKEFISKSIESVLNQTYTNFELLITDDCSTDGTDSIIKEYGLKDKRVKYLKLNQRSGAAIARNNSVDNASGVYLAFLDSDDIWVDEKLDTQIKFMCENNYAFTCTDYGKIDEDDSVKPLVISCLRLYSYDDVLKDCMGNSTVIYNADVLGKFHAVNIKRRNDFVMWLQVIKKARFAYGLNKTLGFHRVRTGSISYDKKSLLKYQWIVYRRIEKLSIPKSIYLIIYKIVQTVFVQHRT